MEFQKGDTIAVLDETIRGIIISIQGKEIVIEDENGFELTYQSSDLVKVGNDSSEFSKFSNFNNALFQQKSQEGHASKKTIPKKSKKQELTPAMEVDLHIQHLVKNSKGMSNYDMLTLQLDTAKYKLEFAIRKRIPRIVFIHGVGEGVLQKELEYLFAKHPVKTSPASYQKYGMGATEVYILQNKKL